MPKNSGDWVAWRRPEDPRRMRAFRDRIATLEWDEHHVMDSLSSLFDAVDDLAEAEVRYYYRRRGTRAWVSALSRLGAWLLGSIGLLLPLLAATTIPGFEDAARYGYAFLAAAASCLAANSLFGGTEGHIRFVSTQLELEKLITSARIEWCRFRANVAGGEKGFALIASYAGEIHATTIAETGRWGETVLRELAKYRKQVESKGGGASS